MLPARLAGQLSQAAQRDPQDALSPQQPPKRTRRNFSYASWYVHQGQCRSTSDGLLHQYMKIAAALRARRGELRAPPSALTHVSVFRVRFMTRSEAPKARARQCCHRGAPGRNRKTHSGTRKPHHRPSRRRSEPAAIDHKPVRGEKSRRYLHCRLDIPPKKVHQPIDSFPNASSPALLRRYRHPIPTEHRNNPRCHSSRSCVGQQYRSGHQMCSD